MQENNKYNNQYELITGTNDNVGSSNDLKDFFILISWVVLIVILFLSSFQLIANTVIDRLSVENLQKIESIFNYSHPPKVPDKYKSQIDNLYEIQRKIIQEDPKIQHRDSLPIGVANKKVINAWIYPNGSIFFTKGLLDENMSEQELAFVLAHEMGHYSNRDNLKAISKQLAIISLGILTGRNNQTADVVKHIANIESLKYSKNQEKNADLYAGKMLIKLYGTNQGGIDAMKRIKSKEKYPEFLQYISDHPLTTDRIYLLEQQQKQMQ